MAEEKQQDQEIAFYDKNGVPRAKHGGPIKGYTANPGGRPDTSELKQACRAKSQDALDTLIEIMNSQEARNMDRIKAAQALLDRGFGKPVQQVQDDTSKKQETYTVVEIPAQKDPEPDDSGSSDGD